MVETREIDDKFIQNLASILQIKLEERSKLWDKLFSNLNKESLQETSHNFSLKGSEAKEYIDKVLAGRGEMTPEQFLEIAVKCHDRFLMESLLEMNVPVTDHGNSSLVERAGSKALASAIEIDRYDMAEYLIAQGVDTRFKDDKGNTILHLIAEHANVITGLPREIQLLTDARDRVLERLIRDLPDKLNEKNANGLTPLDVADKFGNSFEFRVGKFMDAMFAEKVSLIERKQAAIAINKALGVDTDESVINQYVDKKENFYKKLTAGIKKHEQYQPDKLEDLLKDASKQTPELPDSNPLKNYKSQAGGMVITIVTEALEKAGAKRARDEANNKDVPAVTSGDQGIIVRPVSSRDVDRQ
jgi:hypothetical protein